MPRSASDPKWIRKCEICGSDFQQMRPGIRTCGVKCRARLPHNTGGPRAKAGLPRRECPGCGETYQPVRENQRTCSRKCGDSLPDRREAARERDRQLERRERHADPRRIREVPTYYTRRVKKPTPGLEPRECPACGRQFQPYRNSQRACSRACYKAIPEVKRRIAELRKDPERVAVQREANRRNNLRLHHKMTVEEFAARLAAQEGRCKICGQPPKPGGIGSAAVLHADHDHVTLQNRDLLCSTCNVGLGMFGDDPSLLRAAAEYIERHRSAVGGQLF